MSYTALYRKFRPAEFEDVKGQDAYSYNIAESESRHEPYRGMRIYSVGRVGQERQRLQKYLQKL